MAAVSGAQTVLACFDIYGLHDRRSVTNGRDRGDSDWQKAGK